jgi:hypothetical protein
MATQLRTEIHQHLDWDESIFWVVQFQPVPEEWQADDAEQPSFVIGFTKRDELIDQMVEESLDRVTIETVLEDVDEFLNPTVYSDNYGGNKVPEFYKWTVAFLTLVVAWLAWRPQ